MFRVILFIGIVVLSFTSWGFPVVSANDITKSTFKIELATMDPIGSGVDPGQGVTVLNRLLGNVADILLFIIPVIAVVSFIVAGYFYIFSAGDSEKTSKAKTIIKWNIIAIIIALLSYGIVKLIAALFT